MILIVYLLSQGGGRLSFQMPCRLAAVCCEPDVDYLIKRSSGDPAAAGATKNSSTNR